MRGFETLFNMLDESIRMNFPGLIRLNAHKIDGAIFYAAEMNLITSEQEEELKIMLRDRMAVVSLDYR